eukprot:8796604-Karenia_brevis.AAC.1
MRAANDCGKLMSVVTRAWRRAEDESPPYSDLPQVTTSPPAFSAAKALGLLKIAVTLPRSSASTADESP